MTRPAPRDVWWAKAGKKVRICVVLREEPDFFEVAYGQSVHDPSTPSVLVRLGTFEGNRLQVNKDTSFRGTNVAELRAGDFKSLILTPCPPSLFARLLSVVEKSRVRPPASDADDTEGSGGSEPSGQ